jgi:hypothetical protein
LDESLKKLKLNQRGAFRKFIDILDKNLNDKMEEYEFLVYLIRLLSIIHAIFNLKKRF